MSEKQLTLPVSGMTCANCVTTVERNVRKLDGVREANVNFASEKLSLVYDDSLLSTGDIIARVRKAGYDVPEQTLELPIVGMDCVNCAQSVERALRKVEGVVEANVNLASERATVRLTPTVTREALVGAVRKAGYDVVEAAGLETLEDAEQAARDAEIRSHLRNVILGALFTIPLFVLSMGRDFGLFGHWAHEAWVNYVFWALATPVQFYVGREFYTGAVKSIRNGSANMDVLVALGSSVAYFYSAAITIGLLGGHVYFETSASIITLIMTGKLVESLAKGRTSAAIKKLMGLRAKTARVVRDGVETQRRAPGGLAAVAGGLRCDPARGRGLGLAPGGRPGDAYDGHRRRGGRTTGRLAVRVRGRPAARGAIRRRAGPAGADRGTPAGRAARRRPPDGAGDGPPRA